MFLANQITDSFYVDSILKAGLELRSGEMNFIGFQIYLVIWYWYLILIILGAARVGCRVVQYFSGQVRFWLMKMKMHRSKLFRFANSDILDLSG
jgi:hypothetical protein